MLDTEHRACACGKPLRSDNTSGVCYLCQRSGRSSVLCAGGCGRRLTRKNSTGLCTNCLSRLFLAFVATKVRT